MIAAAKLKWLIKADDDHQEEQHPLIVKHKGREYWRTGKLGTGIQPYNMGEKMAEYRHTGLNNDRDERVWHSLKTNQLHED